MRVKYNNMVNYYRLERKKRRRMIKLLLFILIIVTVLFTLFYKVINNKANYPSLIMPIVSDVNQRDSSLDQVVQNALAGTKGSYGVVVKNLKTGESYYSNEHKVYKPGSLYKLWVMAVAYQQIQAGTLKEEQVLSGDVATLNDKFNIDPDLAEQTQGTIHLNIHDALHQMVTISHNYAALLLTEKVKLSSVASFLKVNGFTKSTVGTDGSDPTTTAYDIALFFEKLYQEELVNEQYTREMIDLLSDQRLNAGIPKYLADNSKVANKTGDIANFKHDGGIIFTDEGDYILVVLSESDSPPGAQERIAELSKAVYNYFTRLVE